MKRRVLIENKIQTIMNEIEQKSKSQTSILNYCFAGKKLRYFRSTSALAID